MSVKVSDFKLHCKMDYQEIIDLVKELGVPYRHPHDHFYKLGNQMCEVLKVYAINDYDDETFYHKPYPLFSCHISGCERTFETVMQYESHYNSCHSFTCHECKKNFPNSHLLDLHISETHDFFFMEQTKRKPMFKCFSEECTECFKNPQDRKDHCIKVHKYPSDFRFDSGKKKTGTKKKKTEKHKAEDKMELEADSSEENKMETTEQRPAKTKSKKEFTGLSFGHHQRKRMSTFSNFSKDLMKNLPES